MFLAAMWARHPNELRADFQQYYGLNIDGVGRDYPIAHAAALVTMLPTDGRVLSAEAPELEWNTQTYMFNSIEYSLRTLVWMNTKDAQRNLNRPKHLKTPYDEAKEKRAEESSTPEYMRMVADALNIPEDRR